MKINTILLLRKLLVFQVRRKILLKAIGKMNNSKPLSILKKRIKKLRLLIYTTKEKV